MSTDDVWGDTGRVSGRQLALDIAEGALLALVAGVAHSGQGWWALAAVLVLALALIARHLTRTGTVVLAVLAATLQLGSGELVGLADLAYFRLYFILGGDRRAWVRKLGLAGVGLAIAVAAVGATLLSDGHDGRVGLEPVTILALAMSCAVVCGGGWTAGYLRLQNRRTVQSRIDAQLESVERLRLAQALEEQQERARIAADMHDVVAHYWAVVAAQSDGARYSLRGSPQDAERALEVIGETARSAIADLRRILQELRFNQASGSTPGYRQHQELFARMRASDMDLQVQEAGRPSTSPLLVLTAYRLLGESLTNALKHGDLSRPVHVEQDWTDRYRLTVTNAVGPDGAPGVGARHGIIGMTERAAAAGGRLQVDRAGEEYRVLADIPQVGEEEFS